MIVNIFILIGIILIVLGLAWLTWRAWRIKPKVLKWILTPLAGLFTLLVALIATVAAIGLFKLYMPRGSPPPMITSAANQEQLARGQHLANSICAECHSRNGELPLSGGEDVAGKSPIPIGQLVPYNLTPGGPLKDWSDGEIFRTLREGVDRDGRPLLAMQGLSFRHLSNDDIQSIIAYLRSQEAVTNNAGGDRPNFLLALFIGAGLFPDPGPVQGTVSAAAKDLSPEYGSYIVSYAGCRDCHGPNLTGGSGGLTPKGPQPDHHHRQLETGGYDPDHAHGHRSNRAHSYRPNAVEVGRKAG